MKPPAGMDDLKRMIVNREVVLSSRMESVMRSVFTQPALTAFGTTRSVAGSCDVSASTVQRLAACLGLESFRDLRSLFRTHLSRSSGA